MKYTDADLKWIIKNDTWMVVPCEAGHGSIADLARELAELRALLDGCDFEVVYDMQVGWVLQGEGRMIVPSPRLYKPLPSAPSEVE